MTVDKGSDVGPGCLFCRIAAGEAPATILYQDQEMVAFRDSHPVAPIHVLLVPRKHLVSVAEAQEADADLLGRMMLRAADIARKERLEGDFRLVTNSGPQAGQSVYHLHFHLLGGRRMRWPPG
jgi:histidine triad (HIT) family protein